MKNQELKGLLKEIRLCIPLGTAGFKSMEEYRKFLHYSKTLDVEIRRLEGSNLNNHNIKLLDEVYMVYGALWKLKEKFEVHNCLVPEEEIFLMRFATGNCQQEVVKGVIDRKSRGFSSNLSKEEFAKDLGISEDRAQEIMEGAEMLCSEARTFARIYSVIPSFVFGISQEEAYLSDASNYDFDIYKHPDLYEKYQKILKKQEYLNNCVEKNEK